LLVTGVAASVLLGVIAVAYLSTRSEDLRAVTHGLIALLLLLAVFGVGVDMLDIALPWERIRKILTVVEDGGEMIVASMMVAYALNWSLHLHRQRTVLA
jgi:phosphoglycerate dehydrogenase-like enzyme